VASNYAYLVGWSFDDMAAGSFSFQWMALGWTTSEPCIAIQELVHQTLLYAPSPQASQRSSTSWPSRLSTACTVPGGM